MWKPTEILSFFSDFAHNPAPEGMEQLQHVVEREGQFLENLKLTLSGETKKQNILISTHAIAMKGILEYLIPGSKGAYWSRYIGNCAVYQFALKEGRYSIPTEYL
ncbi:MAG: histidine phosphatase family protein [Bilifractor sp.]